MRRLLTSTQGNYKCHWPLHTYILIIISTFRYEDQQRSVVTEMVSISSGYSEPLASLGAALSRLDALTSLAMAAVSAPVQLTRPRIRATPEGQSAQVSSHWWNVF